MSSKATEAQVDAALQQVVASWQKAWPRLSTLLRMLDLDWSGDEAIRIWVVLEDEDAPEGWPREQVEPIEEAIRGALKEAGVEAWPYINFRGKSEQEDLEREEEEELKRERDEEASDDDDELPSEAAAAQRRS